MKAPDFSREERAFRREIDSALTQLRFEAGPCPHPDLLMAAMSGVELEDAGAILEHADRCPVCGQLSRDMDGYQVPGANAEEDRRIRARWHQDSTSPAPWWVRFWRPVAVVAALAALAGVFVFTRTKQPAAPRSSEVAVSRTSAAEQRARGPELPLEKAAIKIPVAAVLVYRGAGGANPNFLKDLAAALEPYRQDDYQAAARSLEAMLPKYPNAAEPFFYLGVSRLFLDQNVAAVEALQRARGNADDTLRDDISWYLIVAYERTGRAQEARREAGNLCSKPGEYRARACAAGNRLP